MPRYWLEWTVAGRTQPTREPVELPRREAVAYMAGFQRGSSSADRKRIRLVDDAGRWVAGARQFGTVPQLERPGTLGLE